MSKCLYCLSEQGLFTSVEHVYPESIGNKEVILPKGVVCDICNNGILATLDHELITFAPLEFLFAMNNIKLRPKTENFERLNFQMYTLPVTAQTINT